MHFQDPTFEGTSLGASPQSPTISQVLVKEPVAIIHAMTSFGMMEIQGALKGVAEGGNAEGAGVDDAVAEETDEKSNKSCVVM